jgi:hypothetical protein
MLAQLVMHIAASPVMQRSKKYKTISSFHDNSDVVQREYHGLCHDGTETSEQLLLV